MTKRKRSVLLSVLTLLLCLALIAGGTYALFSDKVTLQNHLQAGKLDVKLIRTELLTKSLSPDSGFLVSTKNEKDIDFSEPADANDPNAENKNVFDITENTLIVPACWYAADMQIINNGDVAFGYWLEIVFKGGQDLTLAKQLEITVTTDTGTKSGKLDVATGLIGTDSVPIGVVAKGGSADFNIKVEFCDLEDEINNTAMSKSFSFDLIVHAIQVTDAPSANP